jgi:hypothetical protein
MNAGSKVCFERVSEVQLFPKYRAMEETLCYTQLISPLQAIASRASPED